jgi:hypothetical protein
MNQKQSSSTASAAAGGPAQPYDPELGSREAQPGTAGGSAGSPVTADDTARLMIAALRRGDQPGAGQALTDYRAPASSAAAGDPAAAEAALRDLALRLAELAADAGEGRG